MLQNTVISPSVEENTMCSMHSISYSADFTWREKHINWFLITWLFHRLLNTWWFAAKLFQKVFASIVINAKVLSVPFSLWFSIHMFRSCTQVRGNLYVSNPLIIITNTSDRGTTQSIYSSYRIMFRDFLQEENPGAIIPVAVLAEGSHNICCFFCHPVTQVCLLVSEMILLTFSL